MKRIKIQAMKNGPTMNKSFCFFNAGDVDLFLKPGPSFGVVACRKNGSEIFRTEMNPSYITVFEGTPVSISDRSAFEIGPNNNGDMVCFDPRVVMVMTLICEIVEKADDSTKILNGILEKQYKREEPPIAINPSIKEARDFLRKNSLLRERPTWEKRQGEPITSLKGVPEKVRKFLN